MYKAEEREFIDPIEVGQERVSLSHLQFVDDTLFFIKGDEHKFRKLTSIVDFFGFISGLNINLSKSVVVGINLSRDEKDKLGREVGSWPVSYLDSNKWVGC